jgi:3-oxoacyl-[acyl-carrier protein] reductase
MRRPAIDGNSPAKKRAVILGASGALGSECARRFHADGFETIGTYHDNRPEIEGIIWERLDIRERADIDRFVDTLKERGGIDVLVNTIANQLTFARFEDTPFSVINDDMTVNALHPAYLLQRMVPILSEKACVVFVLTTMVTERPPIGCLSYVMSKYATLGLMQALGSELMRKEIRVNAVSPGMMDTRFVSALPPMFKKLYLSKHHDRFTKPEEVAAAVVALAKDGNARDQNRVVA